jgi:hypothetical protein
MASSRNAYVIDKKTNICYELEPIYIPPASIFSERGGMYAQNKREAVFNPF